MMDNFVFASIIALVCISITAGFNTSDVELSSTQIDCFDMEIMCREDYTKVCHDVIILKATAIGDTVKEGEYILDFLNDLPSLLGKHCSHRNKRSIKDAVKSFFTRISAKFTKAALCKVILKVNELLRSAAPGAKAACALDILQSFFCAGETSIYPTESEFAERYFLVSDRLTRERKDEDIVKSPEFQRLVKSYSTATNSEPATHRSLSSIQLLCVLLGTVFIQCLFA